MSTAEHATSKGTALLLSSSVGFAALYYLTPLLTPMSPVLLAALRIALGVLALFMFFAATKSLRLISETWRQISANWLHLLVVLLCGFMLASQLWLFAYGPMQGRAIQVSLGYFLLPLVLVLVGRFLYKDKLSWWHWLAVIIAASGIGYEFFRVGGFAWEALWVSLMYPLYFIVRRAIGTAHLGGMFWELALITPAALVFFFWVAPSGAFLQRPELWWLAPLIGSFGSVVLIVWILSAKYLPMSIFGLLSYIEPGLLMLVSVLLGEKIENAEYPLYIAVWAAVLIIVIGGSVAAIKQRREAQLANIAPAAEASAPVFDTHTAGDASVDQQKLVIAATGSIPIIDLALATEHTAENPET